MFRYGRSLAIGLLSILPPLSKLVFCSILAAELSLICIAVLKVFLSILHFDYQIPRPMLLFYSLRLFLLANHGLLR